MRMYAHDYIWGVQDRRVHPGPGFGLIDLAFWLHRRLRRAGAPRPVVAPPPARAAGSTAGRKSAAPACPQEIGPASGSAPPA